MHFLSLKAESAFNEVWWVQYFWTSKNSRLNYSVKIKNCVRVLLVKKPSRFHTLLTLLGLYGGGSPLSTISGIFVNFSKSFVFINGFCTPPYKSKLRVYLSPALGPETYLLKPKCVTTEFPFSPYFHSLDII